MYLQLKMKFKKKKNASYNELLSVYMPSLWFFSLFLSLWKRINAYIFRSHSLASFSVCILSPGFRARWISWRVSASFQLNGLFLFHILCVRFRLALVVWCVCVCMRHRKYKQDVLHKHLRLVFGPRSTIPMDFCVFGVCLWAHLYSTSDFPNVCR